MYEAVSERVKFFLQHEESQPQKTTECDTRQLLSNEKFYLGETYSTSGHAGEEMLG